MCDWNGWLEEIKVKSAAYITWAISDDRKLTAYIERRTANVKLYRESQERENHQPCAEPQQAQTSEAAATTAATARSATAAATAAAAAHATIEETAAVATAATATTCAAVDSEETAATANKVKEETDAIAAAEEAAAIATNLAREIDQLKRQLKTERATAATAIATAQANGRIFVPGADTPVSYGEYNLQELQLQVEQLHHQLRAAAHDAKYWADRTYSAEIMNLNMQAVQRRHQPPMQHSESSETSPANADNAAAAALRAAADAADAAARCKDPEVFWAVLKAAATAATQAAALSAPQSSATPTVRSPTHRRGGRPPRGPRKPRAPRQPRNQQRSVQHPDPTANSPGPRSEQSRTQPA
jgi:hypothetical protein